MADPILNDDVAPQYTERRERSAGTTAWDELRKEYGSADAVVVTPGDATHEPVVPDNDGTPEGIAKAKESVAGAVVRNVADIPGGVVQGARNAVQETLNMWMSLGDWLETKMPITPDALKVPKPGELPNVAEAESVTGKVAQDVSQFLVGFAGAGKLTAFKKLAEMGKVGASVSAAGRGAVADFAVMDPYEKKLSDLVESNPSLSNPVTRFLASDPSDNEAERRFKRAAEGLGLGVATEGLLYALKGMRAARIARNEQRFGDPAATPALEATARDLDVIGDPAGDLFLKKTGEAIDAAKGATPGAAAAEKDVFINFARIETPDDIQKVMQTMADAQAGDIKAAARGVRTWEATKASAEQVRAWDELMVRRTGEPLNAEQSLAARQLWVTSAEKLSEVSRIAAANPSDANLVAFRKMLATHYAIQKEVIAARTETARALNAWKIPAGGDAMLARNLEGMLESSGGAQVARQMAERIAALSQSGMSRELEKFVEGTWGAKTRSAVSQVWINALLSNPATHAVNAVSNFTVIGQQMAERRVAAVISDALGTEGGVAAGEAMAMLGGSVAGFREAMRAAWKTAKTGEAQFGLTKLDDAGGSRGALSAEALGIASNTHLGLSMDLVDTVTRIPGRALATSDEFFKGIGYRMELHAQAARQAQAEVAGGTLPAEGVKRRVAEIIENPPENLKIEAIDAALYQTFTQKPAETLKKIADAWQNLPVLGILTMPFKNTPINLLTYAAERSPMAPLVKEWRADMAAGGARADLAMARTATGSMVMLGMIDAALSGDITGKGPSKVAERQNWMRQGNQEYSVKSGDRWYSYSRLDPIGMTVGMAADIAEAMTNADKQMVKGGDTYNAMEEAVIASMFSVAKNVTSKTYMQGVAQFFDAVADPDRHGERYFQRLAGSFVPAGVANAARQVDPYMRTAETTVAAMQKRLPYWSEDLPLYRDLWGRPVSYQSGFGMGYDIFSPVYTKKHAPEAIDTEMKRLDYFPSMPEKKVNFNGVEIDLENFPKAYERYVELAGNGVKDPAWQMGAKDYLNALVTGGHPMSAVYKLYSDGRDGGKTDFIKDTLAKYRKLAKDQVLSEFADLQAEYETKRKPYGNKLDPALFGR